MHMHAPWACQVRRGLLRLFVYLLCGSFVGDATTRGLRSAVLLHDSDGFNLGVTQLRRIFPRPRPTPKDLGTGRYRVAFSLLMDLLVRRLTTVSFPVSMPRAASPGWRLVGGGIVQRTNQAGLRLVGCRGPAGTQNKVFNRDPLSGGWEASSVRFVKAGVPFNRGAV